MALSVLSAVAAAAAALVAGTPRPLPVVWEALPALAAVHVVGGYLLQQVKRHLGIHMLTWMDRIEGPAAADDGGRLLCIVARPRDELKAVEDGSRRERLPQSRLVFVEISQNGGKMSALLKFVT